MKTEFKLVNIDSEKMGYTLYVLKGEIPEVSIWKDTGDFHVFVEEEEVKGLTDTLIQVVYGDDLKKMEGLAVNILKVIKSKKLKP